MSSMECSTGDGLGRHCRPDVQWLMWPRCVPSLCWACQNRQFVYFTAVGMLVIRPGNLLNLFLSVCWSAISTITLRVHLRGFFLGFLGFFKRLLRTEMLQEMHKDRRMKLGSRIMMENSCAGKSYLGPKLRRTPECSSPGESREISQEQSLEPGCVKLWAIGPCNSVQILSHQC